MPLQYWFRIDASYVARRKTVLEAQEDAAIRAALDDATDEERAFVERVIRLRQENAGRLTWDRQQRFDS